MPHARGRRARRIARRIPSSRGWRRTARGRRLSRGCHLPQSLLGRHAGRRCSSLRCRRGQGRPPGIAPCIHMRHVKRTCRAYARRRPRGTTRLRHALCRAHHTCMCMCMRMCRCVCMCMCMRMLMRMCVCITCAPHVHGNAQTHLHCMHVYMHHVRTCGASHGTWHSALRKEGPPGRTRKRRAACHRRHRRRRIRGAACRLRVMARVE